MTEAVAIDERAFRLFVDEYRMQCLWFLRSDYYPTTDAERLEVLRLIERHGDRSVLSRVAEFRRGLSRPSSVTSVTF